MKNYYKVPEVAEILDLSLRKVQYKLQEGEIIGELQRDKPGQPYLVHYQSIKKYLEQEINKHKNKINDLKEKKKNLFKNTFY